MYLFASFFFGRGSFPTKVHLYVPVSLLVSTEVDLVRLEQRIVCLVTGNHFFFNNDP
jgi:hypothetical protein